MRNVLATLLLTTILASVAAADSLVLQDGRTFTGKVTVESEAVLIEMPYGSLRFPKDQVLRVELKDTPEEELAKKLAQTAQDDPNALFALAEWAGQNGLKKQADDLYSRILQIKPDHAPARRALGQVLIDGEWRPLAAAMELSRVKLETGKYDSLLTEVLPRMEEVAVTREKLQEVRELLGHTQLRFGKFADAAETFSSLADKADPPASIRLAAIAEILKANPDGMYVVGEPYPPAASLLDPGTTVLQPGPASLSDPQVLQAALLDAARKQINVGRSHMADAQKLEPSDSEAAKAKYASASSAFDRAEAIVPGIARSYHVEIARRRIAVMRKDVDADARKFDQAMSQLGRKNLSQQEYRELVQRLIHHLGNVRDGLKGVLSVAKPYPSDLVLEIKWAELDLQKTEEMRRILTAELDGDK